jgi:hypothetical protein
VRVAGGLFAGGDISVREVLSFLHPTINIGALLRESRLKHERHCEQRAKSDFSKRHLLDLLVMKRQCQAGRGGSTVK